MNGKLWISLMVFTAWPNMLMPGQESAASGLGNQEWAHEEMQRITVDLSTLDVGQTLVGFSETNQPPWPSGNCLYLTPKPNTDSALPSCEGNRSPAWHVCNMYAENFRALVKREHLESLELGLLGNKECFVVDSRVQQEWLRPGPCHACHSLERRLFLWAKFADCFQKDPQVESLVGTQWVLGSRKDSDGMLERMLPGDSIEFRATELICRTASGEVSAGRSWERSASAPVSLSAYSALSTRDYTGTVVEVTQTPDRLELRGRRSWEVSGSNTPVSIYVYDILSTGDYTGTVVEITRDKDRMVLVPALTLSRSAHTLRRERYQGTAIAIYRPER